MSKTTLAFLAFLVGALLCIAGACGWVHGSVNLFELGIGVAIFGVAIEKAP